MTAYLLAVVAGLTVVNLLNNWLLPGAYTVTCLVAAAVLVASARAAGLSWSELGLPGDLRRGLAWSAVLACLVALVVAAIAVHPRLRPILYDDRAGRLTGAELVFQLLVRIPLGTVLLEEIAFRGVVFAAISRDHGTVAGAAVSSMLFGLWHVLPSSALTVSNEITRTLLGTGQTARVQGAVIAVVATTVAGVALCWLRLAARSIAAPAALHWAINALGLLGAWLVRGHGSTLQMR